jgi:hypothetical protein
VTPNDWFLLGKTCAIVEGADKEFLADHLRKVCTHLRGLQELAEEARGIDVNFSSQAGCHACDIIKRLAAMAEPPKEPESDG